VTVTTDRVRTRRGAECAVRSYGEPADPPVVFLHGAAGPIGDEEFLLATAAGGYRVLAPEWPGYGSSVGEELLEDMLDFALHGWDVVNGLDLGRVTLVGHSMGGMIAAEMAAVSPERLRALVLVSPNGLWDDDKPVVDLFSLLPFQFAEVLFADPAAGAALLTGGVDFTDMEALTEFFVGNSRRLGTAGKILFPIPNRRLSKRLYRVATPTLIAWGSADRYMDPSYALAWQGLLEDSSILALDGAGHMVPFERPAELAAALCDFVARHP
jgi:pimeloyl-ACP methyl ester carboxylesterase